MEIRLHYRYGSVSPTLTLTADEQLVFTRCSIPHFITHRQLMTGLGDTDNPRYRLNDSRVDSYQPGRELTQEDLQVANNFIISDFQAILRLRNAPPIEERAIADVNVTQSDDFISRVQLVFPEPHHDLDNLHMVVNGQVYRLNPVPTGTRDAYTTLQREYTELVNSMRTSVQGQTRALQQEYTTQINNLRTQLARNITLPNNIMLSHVVQYDCYFFSQPDRGRGANYMYWFQLPFVLDQTKLSARSRIYRLKPEFRIHAEGFLTLGVDSRGRHGNDNRWLSTGRLLSSRIEHCHNLGGLTFCSGSMALPQINMAEPVIPQVARIRDQYQELLEVANSGSFGSPADNSVARTIIRYLRAGDGIGRVTMSDEEMATERSAIESGTQAPIPEQRSGINTLWTVTRDDIQRAQQEQERARGRRS